MTKPKISERTLHHLNDPPAFGREYTVRLEDCLVLFVNAQSFDRRMMRVRFVDRRNGGAKDLAAFTITGKKYKIEAQLSL